MDKINFGLWLQREREKRGWSQSDLAKRSGLHRQIINKTENGVSKPAVETYIALAEALNISPIVILRQAGLLPADGGDNIQFEDWQHLLSQLPDEEREELRQIAEMKIKRRKEQGSKVLKPRKAG